MISLSSKANKNWSKRLGKIKKFLKFPFSYLGIALFILVGSLILIFSHSENSPYNLASLLSTKLPQSHKEFFDPSQSYFPESPQFLLVENSSLISSLPPVMITPQVLGSWLGKPETKKEIRKYIVKEGDSLWSIAQKFNISLETIIWANHLKSLVIQPGQELLILPVSGALHLVKEGETVREIAKKYEADPEKIIAFNDLSGEEEIVANQLLIIPDGKLPSVSIIEKEKSFPQFSTNNFYGQSHAYPYGQCTWWVAQKRPVPNWGNAKDWLARAAAAGFPVCRGRYCIPRVGAIISLKGDPLYGHVGYVEKVKGDKVTFSEMNYIGWGKMNYRTLRIGDPQIKGYIY